MRGSQKTKLGAPRPPQPHQGRTGPWGEDVGFGTDLDKFAGRGEPAKKGIEAQKGTLDTQGSKEPVSARARQARHRADASADQGGNQAPKLKQHKARKHESNTRGPRTLTAGQCTATTADAQITSAARGEAKQNDTQKQQHEHGTTETKEGLASPHLGLVRQGGGFLLMRASRRHAIARAETLEGSRANRRLRASARGITVVGTVVLRQAGRVTKGGPRQALEEALNGGLQGGKPRVQRDVHVSKALASGNLQAINASLKGVNSLFQARI